MYKRKLTALLVLLFLSGFLSSPLRANECSKNNNKFVKMLAMPMLIDVCVKKYASAYYEEFNEKSSQLSTNYGKLVVGELENIGKDASQLMLEGMEARKEKAEKNISLDSCKKILTQDINLLKNLKFDTSPLEEMLVKMGEK